jgi:hypothetical protein
LRLIAGGKNHEEAQACEQAADYLRQCADAVPVGTLAISTFRGRSEKQNRDFDYTGGLPDGSYSLYTAPMPAAPQELAPQELAQLAPPKREPCIGNNPACPCQDGDACHYKDTPTTKAWPIPQAEPKRPQIEVSLAAGLGYWGVALCVGAQSFALLAEFATLTEAEEYAERLRAALGITGGSDAE